MTTPAKLVTDPTVITALAAELPALLDSRYLQLDASDIAYSGRRDVSSLLLNGWVAATGVIQVHRLGRTVEVDVEDIDGSANTSNLLLELPTGFRPPLRVNGISVSDAAVQRQAQVNAVGEVEISTSGAETVSATIRFTTEDAWPLTLPGVAV